MPIFDEQDSKLIPFTTLERMVAALSISLRTSDITASGKKMTAKIKTKDEFTRTPSVNSGSGEYNCSCEDYHFKKMMCKHVIALIFWLKVNEKSFYDSFMTTLGRPEFQKYATIEPTGYLSFQVKILDDITKGGLPLSIVTGYTGKPEIGKTWLAYQTGVVSNIPKEQGGLGRPALYINVEADFLKEGVQDRFHEYFKKRFNRDYQIDFLFPRSLVTLFELFGIGLELKKSPKRVVPNFWDETDPLESPIAILQKRMNYGIIIIDSMTSGFKKEVPVPPNQNISSQRACMNVLWGRFENLVENFQIGMVVTHHTTKDPTSSGFGDPYGGDSIMYNMKHVLHLLGPTKELSDQYGYGARRILRARWPGLIPVQVPVILAVNSGFIDAVTKEEKKS